MDLLDQVVVPGRDLLGRVDVGLAACGAPAGHEVWRLLRAVGAVPGDVLEQVAALRPDPLGELAVKLRTVADGYAGRRAVLNSAIATNRWDGPAGREFSASWQALGSHLGDGELPDEASMAGRMVALRAYVDDVGGWMVATRRQLAVAVAEALGSAEAVELVTGRALDPSGAPALAGDSAAAPAVTIAVRVLRPMDEAIRTGFAITARWRARLGELPFQFTTTTPTIGGRTEVDLT